MEDCHKEVITTCFATLVEDLEPDVVMRYLYEKHIISDHDMDDLRSENTRREKNTTLLLKLKRKGPDAFKRLVEGLQKNQSFLAENLLLEGKSVVNGESLSQSRDIFSVYFHKSFTNVLARLACPLDFLRVQRQESDSSWKV